MTSHQLFTCALVCVGCVLFCGCESSGLSPGDVGGSGYPKYVLALAQEAPSTAPTSSLRLATLIKLAVAEFGEVATTVDEIAAIAPKGGIGPVLKGQAGVDQAIAEIEAAGHTVLGREITVEVGGIRTRPDLLIQRSDGLLEFIEVKNGPSASLTANQITGFPLIQSGGAIPRGANAANAGLSVGTPLGPTLVRIVKYP